MRADFIGTGWAFPGAVDATGATAMVRGDREIIESIGLILATSPGERPMRPTFGCAIHDLVFAPANAATAGRLAHQVRHALEMWEPRIDLEEVTVGFDEVDDGRLLIDLRYTVRDDDNPRNLVFPFYLIPSHGGA